MKAVIFDLDGTLLYTLENLFESANYVLKQHGYNERTIEEIRNFVGNGVEKLIERCLPDGADSPDFGVCLSEFKAHYSRTMYEKTRPYDGVLELLGRLKEQGIVCAVVSNKYDAAVKELCKRYFGDLIEVAAGEREDVRKKPAPDGVFAVMDRLGTRDCVYVGDSEVDILTAKNAGLPCVSVCWGYKDEAFLVTHGAKKIAHSIEELERILLLGRVP